jgi:hypothetical protein
MRIRRPFKTRGGKQWIEIEIHPASLPIEK